MLTRFRALLIIISLVAGCPMHSGRSAVEACVDLGQRPADLVECSVSPCVKQVAADYAGWCALMDGGDVQCWGLGPHKQLHRDIQPVDWEYGRTPQPMPGVQATELFFGRGASCYRELSGAVSCWGRLPHQATGVSPIEQPTVPLALPLAKVEHLAVGGAHMCAILSGGQVSCAGDNGMGELGRTTPLLDSNQLPHWEQDLQFGPGPVVIEAEQMAVGSNYSCALGRQKSFCWGQPPSLALIGRGGEGDDLERLMEPKPSKVSGIVQLEPTTDGGGGLFVVQDHGVVSGTGRSMVLHELLPDYEAPYEPTRAMVPGCVTSLAVGAGDFACALTNEGLVYCWGRNHNGELGQEHPDTEEHLTPELVPNLDNVVQIEARYGVACALQRSGQLLCWGDNSGAELGQGTTDNFRTRGPIEPIWDEQ